MCKNSVTRVRARVYIEDSSVIVISLNCNNLLGERLLFRRIVSGIMLILLLIGMLTLAFDIQLVRAVLTTWTVDDDGPADFSTIQEAINAASWGDTIHIKNGIYYERVTISKSISLFGENNGLTIIDGNGTGTIVYVKADHVTVDGFTMQNSGYSEDTLYNPACGVRLGGRFNNSINGNIMLNNQFGIRIVAGEEYNIRDNRIANNTCGIYMVYSKNFVLKGNNIYNNTYNFGVWGYSQSEFVHDIDTSNFVNGKLVYYLINQNGLVIDSSTFPNMGYLGIASSTNIIIKNSTLMSNYQGILLAFVTNSTIKNVNVSKNNVGVCLISSGYNSIRNIFAYDNNIGVYILGRNNTVSESTLYLNKEGMYIWGSRSINTIYHNDFINNLNQAIVGRGPADIWDDGYPSGGNYWSDYNGTDLFSGSYQNETGSDGIGDIPYVIDEDNADRYPLVKPLAPTPTGITVNIDIDPDTLNLKSKGRWITAYIELHEDCDVTDVNRTAILLNGTIPVDPFWVDKPFDSVIGDYDNDTVPDLMVKFCRKEVIDYITNQNVTWRTVTLTITGELCDGTPFEGSNSITTKMFCDVTLESENTDTDYVVVPEFPSFLILPIFMIATLLAVIVYRRKRISEAKQHID